MPQLTTKASYTEIEAAAHLEITVSELRMLIRSQVVDDPEDAANIPATTFQPSDLVVLRFLANHKRALEQYGVGEPVSAA